MVIDAKPFFLIENAGFRKLLIELKPSFHQFILFVNKFHILATQTDQHRHTYCKKFGKSKYKLDETNEKFEKDEIQFL